MMFGNSKCGFIKVKIKLFISAEKNQEPRPLRYRNHDIKNTTKTIESIRSIVSIVS